MIKKLYILKKERGIRPLTVKLGIALHSDMSSKEISLVCKVNIFLYYQRKNKNHRGQVNRPERVNQGTCPCDPPCDPWSIIGEIMESNCYMIEKMPPKGVSFSDFICTFAMSCYDLCLF